MEKSPSLRRIIVSLLCLLPYSQTNILGLDFFLAKLLYIVAIIVSFINFRKFKLWYLLAIVPTIISYLQSSFKGSTEHENVFMGILNLFVFYAIITVQLSKYMKIYLFINAISMLLFVSGIGVEWTLEGPKFMGLNQNLFSLCLLLNLILFIERIGFSYYSLFYLPLCVYSILILDSRYAQIMLLFILLVFIRRQLNIYTNKFFNRLSFFVGIILVVLMLQRLVNFTANDLYALSSRTLIWALVIEEYNVFTVFGFGQTPVINFVSQSLATDRTSIHNILIEILLSSGFVGLFIFGSWVLKLFKAVIAARDILVLGLVSIMGYLIIGQFYEDLLVWSLVAIVYDVSIHSRNFEVRREGKTIALSSQGAR